MAVDSPVLYNNAWVYLRDTMGTQADGTAKMQHNAELFYNILRVFGYSLPAAAGVLGNIQVESQLSPGALYGDYSQLINNGEHLSDMTNSALFQWINGSIGLIQWKGASSIDGYAQIPSFANRYDLLWYNWELQLFRLEMEYIYDPAGWGGVNGTTYNFWYPSSGTAAISWAQYKTFSGTPEQAAQYFQAYRERGGTDTQTRQATAREWYNYFSNTQVTTEVSNVMNACMAYLFRDSRYPYSTYDCIGFVNLVRRRLGLGTIGDYQGHHGTNSLWRSTDGQLTWKGTLQECIDLYGGVPEGAYLFKCYPEGTPGYNTIPDYYRGDGIGNFDHIGIYTNRGLGVMQSGGYDVTPPSGFNGVHDTRTRLDESPPWWTHVGFGKGINFGTQPTPPTPTYLPIAIFCSIIDRKRRLLKNVWKS